MLAIGGLLMVVGGVYLIAGAASALLVAGVLAVLVWMYGHLKMGS